MRKRISRKHWVIIMGIVLAITLLFAGCRKNEGQEEPGQTPDEQSTEADDGRLRFTTTDLDGNIVDESIFDGYDLIVLNFWAYWCGPCKEEMPALEQLHQSYPNILLLGIIVDESDMDSTRAVIESAGVTYRILYPGGDLETLACHCQYIPTTFFVNAKGLLLGAPTVGAMDLAGWTDTVESYLK